MGDNHENQAWREAEIFYAKNMPGTTVSGVIREVVNDCWQGHVFVGPEYVLIGYRHGNGWLIVMASGKKSLAHFARLMPYYLPWIGWSRVGRGRKEVRWHSTIEIAETLRKVGEHEAAEHIYAKARALV